MRIRRYRLPLLAFFSSLAIVLIVSRTPQSIFSDPGWQLKAMQQHLAGESPTINTLVEPDPRDLSHDVREWISWWPIGTNLLVYPMLRLGLSIAASVRLLAALALILGSVGFGFWLRLFRLPQWLLMGLAVGIPWIRYANLSLFQYAAEGLVFAVCPWLLLGAFWVRSAWMEKTNIRVLHLLAFGALLGFAYWMKYSAVFISVAVIVHLALLAWKLRGRAVRDLSLIGTAFLVIVLALNVWNRSMGAAMNSVTEQPAFLLDWHLPFNFVGLMAMSMADADGLARYVLFHPGRALLPFSYSTLCLIGLPGGLLLFWVLVRRHSNPALSLARDVLLAVSVLFIAVMLVFSARAMEARYIAAIGIAMLPAAFEAAWSLPLRRPAKALMAGVAIAYVFIPIAYGAVGKVHRTPPFRAGESGLYNELLATTDARTPLSNLISDFDPRSDLWYVTEPLTAMDLPGRAIIRHADFLPREKLRESFHASQPMRVRLLLPARFEQSGKGQIIRANFPDAVGWSSQAVPSLNYVEWIGTLRPPSGSR